MTAAQEKGSITGAVLQGAGDHLCPGGNPYRVLASSATSLPAAARGSIDLFDGFCRLRTLPVPVRTLPLTLPLTVPLTSFDPCL